MPIRPQPHPICSILNATSLHATYRMLHTASGMLCGASKPCVFTRRFSSEHPGCSEQHLICSEQQPRCFEQRPRCSAQHPRCTEHHPRCSEQHPRCSEQHPRCSENKGSQMLHPKCSAEHLGWERAVRCIQDVWRRLCVEARAIVHLHQEQTMNWRC